MKRKIIIGIWLVLLPILSTAQPAIDFFRTYDSGRQEMFYDVFKVMGDGYILCGENSDNFLWQQAWRRWILRDNVKIWLVRINDAGEVLWSQSYPEGDQMAGAMSIIETDEGNFITVGKLNQEENVDFPYAILVDFEGNEIWSSTYGGEDGEFRSVIELKGGGFLISGQQLGDGYAVLINGEGDLLWETRLDAGGQNDLFTGMRETEGGVILGGGQYTHGGGGMNIWTVKLDFNGEVLWNVVHAINELSYAWCYDIVSTQDGGFALSGSAMEQNGNLHNFALYKIDNNGNLLWHELYLLPGEGFRNHSSTGFGMGKLDHDDFVLVGGKCLDAPGAVCTSANGEVRWSQTYDFEFNIDSWNYFNKAIRGPNNEIVAVGTINWSAGQGFPFLRDALLMILEPQFLEPQIIEYIPLDTVFTVLVGDSVDFTIRAHDDQQENLLYLWIFDDDTLGIDTTETIVFEELGEHLVQCFVTDEEFTVSVRWHVSAVEWFLRSFRPDSIALTIQRGATVDFAVEVAAVEGLEVDYLWTLTRRNQQEEEIGDSDSIPVVFDQAGEHSLLALVTDGESSEEINWTIDVRSSVYSWWPSELELSAYVDSTYEFVITPFNENSDSLEYLWLLDDEQLESDRAMALITFPESGFSEVTSIIHDGIEADTIRWMVDVSEWSFTADDANFADVPTSPVLYPASPNPFNSSVKLSMYLPKAGYVSLAVFDVNGREVSRLVEGDVGAGNQTFVWNASDFPAGVYLVRMEAGSTVEMRKVVLVR